MPRSKLDLPEFLSKKLPEHLLPTRIDTNRLAFPSPFEAYPGKAITPIYLSAEDYHEWWTRAGGGQPEDDDRHWSFWEWETRFHLVKAWHFESLDSDQLKEDPIGIPDQRFLLWMIQILQPILEEATSVPKSPGPLKNGATKNEKSPTAKETSGT